MALQSASAWRSQHADLCVWSDRRLLLSIAINLIRFLSFAIVCVNRSQNCLAYAWPEVCRDPDTASTRTNARPLVSYCILHSSLRVTCNLNLNCAGTTPLIIRKCDPPSFVRYVCSHQCCVRRVSALKRWHNILTRWCMSSNAIGHHIDAHLMKTLDPWPSAKKPVHAQVRPFQACSHVVSPFQTGKSARQM